MGAHAHAHAHVACARALQSPATVARSYRDVKPGIGNATRLPAGALMACRAAPFARRLLPSGGGGAAGPAAVLCRVLEPVVIWEDCQLPLAPSFPARYGPPLSALAVNDHTAPPPHL